jgi:hypothetical protein
MYVSFFEVKITENLLSQKRTEIYSSEDMRFLEEQALILACCDKYNIQ